MGGTVGGVVLLGLLAEHAADSWTQPAWIPILDLAIGWLLVGCGLVAAATRPGQPAGRRLTLAGYLWFVGTFVGSALPIVGALGFGLGGWYDLVLLWIALSFPGRRPVGRVANAVLALVAGLFMLHAATRLGVRLLPVLGIAGPGMDAAEPLIAWIDVLRASAVVVGGIVILGRLARATVSERRHLWPVLAAGAISAIAAGFSARSALTMLGLIPDPGEDIVVPVAWAFNIGRLLVPLAILVGVLRLRQARSALAGAIARVGDRASVGELGSALAAALGDPDLRVLEWREDQGAYVDAAGTIVPGATLVALDADPSKAVVRVTSGTAALALLVLAAPIAEDEGLVAAGVALTRLVVRNGQQALRIEEQLADVRASRARIVEAADVERRRIERDLHDGLQQRMVALAMQLRAAETSRGGRNHDDALRQGSAEILAILEDVRELARGIHPAVLSEAGLGAALRAAADRSPVPAEIDVRLTGRGTTAAQATAYFVVSEALANVAKHAAGASCVWIRASDQAGVLRVEIVDDGPGGAAPGGHGLAGLADRVAALDGRFAVEQRAAGGTMVVAEVPIR